MSASVQTQIALRSRKLGVLIRDARLAHNKGLKECAAVIGVGVSTLRAYEEGRKSPSLPELEILAYFFDLTIQHFWSSEALSDDAPRADEIDMPVLMGLRQRMVGVRLRQQRMDASVSLKALAQDTGISSSRLTAYELGRKSISLPELEACLSALGGRIETFFDEIGPVGKWMTQKQAIREFLKLSPEMQEFVCKPVNRPYLDLALKLSDMSTDKLRSVAEGLLDITL